MDVLVAVDDDDRVLGFTSIGTCFDDDRRPGGLEIWDLWVDREQRSRGIGAVVITDVRLRWPRGVVAIGSGRQG